MNHYLNLTSLLFNPNLLIIYAIYILINYESLYSTLY
jgi:hypothetical protein